MSPEPLRLKIDKEPTYLNQEMIIGSWVFPIGTVVGAIIGKERMEREQRDGKEVKPPSLLNREMLVGATIGSFLSIIPAIIAGVAGGAVGALIGGDIPTGTTLVGAQLAAVVGALSAMPIGAYIGATRGKANMEKEYAQAEEQQRLQAHNLSPEHEHQPHKENHFTQMVENQRKQQAAQGYSV